MAKKLRIQFKKNMTTIKSLPDGRLFIVLQGEQGFFSFFKKKEWLSSENHPLMV